MSLELQTQEENPSHVFHNHVRLSKTFQLGDFPVCVCPRSRPQNQITWGFWWEHRNSAWTKLKKHSLAGARRSGCSACLWNRIRVGSQPRESCNCMYAIWTQQKLFFQESMIVFSSSVAKSRNWPLFLSSPRQINFAASFLLKGRGQI